MASRGVHTNGSQFYIDLAPAPHLNGRCVVFGRIIEGDQIIKEMEKVFTVRCTPVRDINITGCGYHSSEEVHALIKQATDSSSNKSTKKEMKAEAK
jgi:peptidyl-prolyl isomerase D